MKTVILIICIGLFFIACKKGNVTPYKSEGVITGYDMRMCASPECGGLLITIKKDSPFYFHTRSTLTQLGIKESAKLPINVSLNYEPDTGIFRAFHYIVVTQVKVVN